MKKGFLFVAVAALSVGTLVSCGKSSKGKMDGEWNVDSKTISSTDTDQSGTSSDVTKIEGTTITMTSTDENGNSSTVTGTVSAAAWNIMKDGTWDRELAYTTTGNNSSETKTKKSSGKWDFAAGVGEFKKNERVVFNTLSETTTTVSTFGSISSTSTGTSTYLDGENSEVFVITESKKKALEMEAKGANSYTSGNYAASSTSTTTYKMTLK